MCKPNFGTSSQLRDGKLPSPRPLVGALAFTNIIEQALKHSVTRQRKNDNADIILREKVIFAKRLLSKGFQEKEALELANITESDIIKIKDLL